VVITAKFFSSNPDHKLASDFFQHLAPMTKKAHSLLTALEISET